MTDSGFNLAGFRVIVTGASSGIGAAIASRLAGAGARVVGVSRSGDVPQSTESIVPLVADLSEPQQTDSVIDRAAVILGGSLLRIWTGTTSTVTLRSTCGHRFDCVSMRIRTWLQVTILRSS